MTHNWPIIPLGEVLEPITRPETVKAQKTYNILGAHWYAKGLYTKSILAGTEIRANKVYRVEEGDFVYNRLFAWKGSFAVATKANHNCFVSNEFPCFLTDKQRLDGKYLWFYFSRESAWLKALGLSTGGTPTSRNRLKQEKLLAMNIPLPPLDEQRRIVARIEELAAKVEQAQSLRQKSMVEVEALLASESFQLFDSLLLSSKSLPIGKIISFRNDLIRPTDGVTGSIRFVGLQHVESHTGIKIGEDILLAEELKGRKFKFSPGEIVYGYLRPYLNKVWIADCNGVCSVDQYVIRPNTERIDTQYLAYFMRSPAFLQKANELTHNLLLPRLRTALLKSIVIPLPSFSKQRRIVAYLDSLQAKVEAVKRHQAATAAKLDALLSSILDKAFKGEL